MRIEPPVPQGWNRRSLREAIAEGSYEPESIGILAPLPAGAEITTTRVRVEPLAAVLTDTVPELTHAAATTVLDAARRREGDALEREVVRHLGLLRTRGARQRWESRWDFSDPRSESPGESASRSVFAQFGLSPAQLQGVVELRDHGRVRVDFLWREARVVGEFDGRIKYGRGLAGSAPHEVVYREKLREDALRRAGWIVVRWTWEDLRNPHRLVRRLVDAGVTLT